MNLGNRVAEEAQLLAEEKWIIEALEKVKTQRNCLQIERLQLESMKKQLEDIQDKHVDTAPESRPAKVPESERQNLVQKLPPETAGVGFSKTLMFETESLCNNEELNLKVSNSVFSQIHIEDINAEEDEDEFDEEDGEDLLLDMNMFMHASQTNNTAES